MVIWANLGKHTHQDSTTDKAFRLIMNGFELHDMSQVFPAIDKAILVARKWLARGLVKFVSAVAYHLFLNLPAAFLQPLANHKWAPST